MPTEAVLFDLDGVLIDSRPVWFELLNGAARHFGHPLLGREVFDASFGQGVEADANQFFGGMPPAELEAWFDAHFLDHADQICVEPDAGAVFQALSQRGLSRAVVTNSSRALAAEVLRAAGLEPDALVASSDVPRPKPAPDGLLRACQLLGVDASAARMVGDSRFDREAADAAGVPFVGYRTAGPRRIERLSELLFLDAA
ncbi:MAG: HAD family hydrolase [Myxococcota bacterium]